MPKPTKAEQVAQLLKGEPPFCPACGRGGEKQLYMNRVDDSWFCPNGECDINTYQRNGAVLTKGWLARGNGKARV